MLVGYVPHNTSTTRILVGYVHMPVRCNERWKHYFGMDLCSNTYYYHTEAHWSELIRKSLTKWIGKFMSEGHCDGRIKHWSRCMCFIEERMSVFMKQAGSWRYTRVIARGLTAFGLGERTGVGWGHDHRLYHLFFWIFCDLEADEYGSWGSRDNLKSCMIKLLLSSSLSR